MLEDFLDQALRDKFILMFKDPGRNITPSLLPETNLDFKRAVDIVVRIQPANSDSTRRAKQDHSEIFRVMTKEKTTQPLDDATVVRKKHVYDETVLEKMRKVRFVILKAMSLRLAEPIRHLSDARLKYLSPFLTGILVSGHEIITKIDTGFPISIISSRDFNLLGRHYEPTDANLVSFSGHPIKPIGGSDVQVAKGHKTFKDTCLFVITGQTFLEGI
ncbi:hypothetical protein HZS_5310, partial [Henneguya salminicola]